MLNHLLSKLIKLIRPNFSADGDLSVIVLVGWYLRKGLLPGIRGVLHSLRFGRVSLPIFLGRGSTISYARRIRLGRGSSIGSNAVINAFSVDGIELGEGVTIRENSWIQCSSSPGNPGAGLIVGSNTYIGPGSILGIGGPVVIGEGCQIGASFTVVAENHEVDAVGASNSKVIRKGITIGDNCWVGHRVTVLDGVTLGENCVVGAGAVVTKSFPAKSTLVGVPARSINSQTAMP